MGFVSSGVELGLSVVGLSGCLSKQLGWGCQSCVANIVASCAYAPGLDRQCSSDIIDIGQTPKHDGHEPQ